MEAARGQPCSLESSLLGLTPPPLLPQKLFEQQLKKYDQLRVYLDQNLAAQENVLKALTEANVQYAAVRRVLTELEHKSVPCITALLFSGHSPRGPLTPLQPLYLGVTLG